MVTVNSKTQTINLSNFLPESTALYSAAVAKIHASQTQPINLEIQKEYKLEPDIIRQRLDAIIRKFRKAEMNFYLYFDGADHNLLVSKSTDLPIMRECIFLDNGAKIKMYFEVDDRQLYQELIDYNFQEFMLFVSSLLENMVHLSETLIKKISVHSKKNPPQSYPMATFVELLKYLHRLNYRSDADPLAVCIQKHDVFLSRYLATITTFRNRYIHAYPTKLKGDSVEYLIIDPESPINGSAPDLNVSFFTKTIIDHLKNFIPDFFDAITATISSAPVIPA
jgi:hypothetical protein